MKKDMKKESMSICDKRGHYYLPIDIPVQEGFFWSITPPKPERKLYCRRCGKTQSLAYQTYKSTGLGSITLNNTSATYFHYFSSPMTTAPSATTATIPWLSYTSSHGTLFTKDVL